MDKRFCGYRDCTSLSASFICNRCQTEFYCSKKCQVSAFSTHRFNCFELPTLRLVNNVSLELSKLSLSNLSGCEVEELEMPIKQLSVEKLPENVIDEKKSPLLPQSLIPSQVTAKKKEGIQETEKPREAVVETKKHQEIVVAPTPKDKETKKPAVLANPQPKVQDDNVPALFPASTDSKSTNFSQKEVEPKTSFMSMFSKTEVIKKVQAVDQPKPVQDDRIYYEKLTQCSLPSTKFTSIFLAGNTETKMFLIMDAKNSPILEKIESTIVEIGKTINNEPYIPVVNELVLAKFEGNFYRGTCIEVRDNRFSIYYIDYGNSEVIAAQEIRKIDMELIKFPVIVHSCYMENLPDTIEGKVAEILTQENGIVIEDVTKGKENCFVGRIFGL